MGIRNSAIRKLKRRKVALANFSIVPKSAFDKDTDYDAYVARKERQRSALIQRTQTAF